jgi:phage terminase small subunit
MGKRGPSPLPGKLKLLRGKPGHHPINENEPEFEGEITIPPHILKKKEALAEWNRRAPELEAQGLLNGQFQTEFADYCIQHAYYLELHQEVEDLGMELAIAKGIWKAFQSASAQRLRLAGKFGFDPSDASGVKAKPKEKKEGARRFLA